MSWAHDSYSGLNMWHGKYRTYGDLRYNENPFLNPDSVNRLGGRGSNNENPRP